LGSLLTSDPPGDSIDQHEAPGGSRLPLRRLPTGTADQPRGL